MPEPWTVIIALHAIAASSALLIGTVQIIRQTRGDPIHIALGRIWAVLMFFTAASSFFFGGWTEPLDIFLRALAILTFVTIPTGVWAARQGNIARHRGAMTGNYFGLVGAFIGVVAFKTRLVPSWFIAYPVLMSLIALALFVVCGVVVGAVFLANRPGRQAPPIPGSYDASVGG